MQSKIIAKSYNPHLNTTICTFELDYWRAIHAELLTHRMFNKNSQSSRAVPITAVIKLVAENPAGPQFWGANQAGMQASQEVQDIPAAKEAWKRAANRAVESALELNSLGLHKQIVNRVLEPFCNIKVVLTATDFNNFWWLRKHKDAQPEFKYLAEEMHDLYFGTPSETLLYGDWHVPYVNTDKTSGATSRVYLDEKGNVISANEALKISASCCAQASYRKNDTSLEKAESIFSRLIESEPVHASPTEHQATPMDAGCTLNATKGVTHEDKNGVLYSGPLRNWIQHRQLIPNNAKRY